MTKTKRLEMAIKMRKLFRSPMFPDRQCPFCSYDAYTMLGVAGHVKKMHPDKYTNKYEQAVDLFIKEFNL